MGKRTKIGLLAIAIAIVAAAGVVLYPVVNRSYQKIPTTALDHSAILWGNNIDSLEKLDLTALTEMDLLWVLAQAKILKHDTAMAMGPLKSFILFDKVSKELERRVFEGETDPNNPTSRYLHTQLEKEQFLINIYQPSQLDKLYGYVIDGNFEYVWRRAAPKLFYPSIGLGVLLVAGGAYWYVRRRGRKQPENSITT